MAKYIGLLRLQRAILALQQWRAQVDSQGAMHLVHFLAAKFTGVNRSSYTVHTEDDDRDFCDRVLRVRPGAKPYYDPLDDSFRIDTHYHSNVATARKKTFSDRWRAASYKSTDGSEVWKFSDDYLEILQAKVVSKAGLLTRVPLYDLCAWIYRSTAFDDASTLKDVKRQFVADYHISKDELEALFSERDVHSVAESGNGYFATTKLSEELVLRLVENVKHFDATDAIIEIAQVQRRSPVKTADIVSMIKRGRRQLILQGPPGTGKTYQAKQVAAALLEVESKEGAFERLYIDPNSVLDAERATLIKASGGWTLVQMHPSYSYEDFVRGIFAEVTEAGPSFSVQDRTFSQLCRVAGSTSRDVVIIMDEINRADLSKVLGELVYAMEYRNEPVSLQYARNGTNLLRVPQNIVVIGTMNTADHSIAHVDYAIRRRFDFVEIVPDASVIHEFHSNNEVLRANSLLLFKSVNDLLEGSRDQAVGHSFFLGLDAQAVATSFVFQVLPLLSDYRKEGIIEDIEAVGLPGWPGSGIPLYAERPFDLVERLIEWLGQDNAKSG